MNNFVKRLLSGIVLVIIALGVILTGGELLLATLTVISIIGMYELYRALGFDKKIVAFVAYIGAIAYYIIVWQGLAQYEMILSMGVLIALMAVFVLTYPKYSSDEVMRAYFGLFYVAFMLSFIYKTRVLEDGIYTVWLIFIASWGCDTCAYCVGLPLSRKGLTHKLTEKLSPKKSIEGAIGGVVGAALLGVIFGLVFRDKITGFDNPVVAFAIVCGISSVIAQIGDLAASGIKRNHDIKDYGRLIPGHGGILDRFDSVIFTAPAIYFLLTVLA